MLVLSVDILLPVQPQIKETKLRLHIALNEKEYCVPCRSSSNLLGHGNSQIVASYQASNWLTMIRIIGCARKCSPALDL